MSTQEQTGLIHRGHQYCLQPVLSSLSVGPGTLLIIQFSMIFPLVWNFVNVFHLKAGKAPYPHELLSGI